MDLSNAIVDEPPAILRGTSRGLELIVNGRAPIDAIASTIEARIGEAPAFFRGNDIRIAVDDGPLATGCLGKLDELAAKYDLRIVEVGALAAPKPDLAAGSAPVVDELAAIPEPIAPVSAPMPAPTIIHEVVEHLVGPKLVIGPVRSGVILDHVGHVVVFGDVNPGAEVRATGNIVVLGRLRGTAHAGIGAPMGFILALRLEPQQLRIGRQVARAGDSDTPDHDAEIAYATGEQIVVERYQGRLPKNLAASL
ncbi:MAG TPA: septum site-determining protein MinC [Kofleriaceae bacterium]|jgi:septum site-determining protein MinC